MVALVQDERICLMDTERINRLLLDMCSVYADGVIHRGDTGVVSGIAPSEVDQVRIRRLEERIAEIERSHSYRFGRRAAALFRRFWPAA